MIKASKQYKQAMSKPIRNRAFATVSLGVVNQNAQSNASVVAPQLESWSNGDIFGSDIENYSTYATLETDFITCDGKMICMPKTDQYLTNGLVFKQGIKEFTIRFGGNPYAIKGLTIDFGADFATHLKVYTDNNVEHNFDITSGTFETEEVFDETTSLRFVFTMPNDGRIRIRSMKMGIGLVFTNSLVENISLEEFVSHISEELSYANLTANIFDTEGKFDVDNDESFMNFLEPMQPLAVSVGLELDDGTKEWFQIAKLKLNEWKTSGGKITLTASDKLSLLDADYEHLTLQSRTVASELVRCLTDCGYFADEYKIDPFLSSVYMTSPIEKCSHRECIQTICNAYRCVFYENEEGILVIKANFEDAIDLNEIETSYSAQKSYAKPDNILNNSEVFEYADASTNMIKADGTPLVMDEEIAPSNAGFVSNEIADANGHFAESPFVELRFPYLFSYYGIAVEFGGNPPKKVSIDTKRNGVVIQHFEYTDIEANQNFMDEFEQFDTIRLTVTETDPYSRVMINSFKFDSFSAYKINYDDMLEKPFGYTEPKVKEVRVKVFSYQQDGDKIKEIENEVYETIQINLDGVTKTLENPLINTVSQAKLVAKWLSNYYRNNVSYSIKYRGEPRLQANDVIGLESKYKGKLQVDVEKMVFNFNGAFNGAIEARRLPSANRED